MGGWGSLGRPWGRRGRIQVRVTALVAPRLEDSEAKLGRWGVSRGQCMEEEECRNTVDEKDRLLWLVLETLRGTERDSF